MQHYSSIPPHQALERKIVQEFVDPDGKEAQWAPGVSGPRFWDEEDAILHLDAHHGPRNVNIAAACSPDQKFLAVANKAHVLIYNFDSKLVQAPVLGHESAISSMHFSAWTPEHAEAAAAVNGLPYDSERVKYLLFVVGAMSNVRFRRKSAIIIWPVDGEGRFYNDSPPLAVEETAENGIRAMSLDLKRHEDISQSDIDSVRAVLVQKLESIELRQRKSRRQVLHGDFPKFAERPISKDGSKCIYLAADADTEATTTRHRNSDQVIAVWDIGKRQEICRLTGHEGRITWAVWAADDQMVITTSTDRTFRFWNAETGECRHQGTMTGHPGCLGAVSPDGQYVALTDVMPNQVAIYFAATGMKTTNLVKEPIEENGIYKQMTLNWDPSPDEVVMTREDAVMVMDPATGSTRTILDYPLDGTSLQSSAMTFDNIQWFDEGRILVVRANDDTLFVWDKVQNCKWRFQRTPYRERCRTSRFLVHYIARQHMIVSVDTDRKVRFWKL